MKNRRLPPPLRLPAEPEAPFLVKEFSYALDGRYGKVRLGDWLSLKADTLAVIAGSDEFAAIDPAGMLFFDSETTGLAGGTGTVPFMLGFGYFADQAFQVRIFVLLSLDKEGEFLEAVARFLEQGGFSAVATYNGKAFDFPLLETRYILQRQRFPLRGLPHLDFLFPARTIWRNTFDSRKLGYLGEMLLGLSREDDIEGSDIPALYFSFLRSQAFSLIEPVVEHNAMDLVGLAAVVLLGVLYLDDYSLTGDGGEIFGLGRLCERAGLLEKAEGFYKVAREVSARSDVARPGDAAPLPAAEKKEAFQRGAGAVAAARRRARCPGAAGALGALRAPRARFRHGPDLCGESHRRRRPHPGPQQEMEKRLQRLQQKIARLEENNEINLNAIRRYLFTLRWGKELKKRRLVRDIWRGKVGNEQDMDLISSFYRLNPTSDDLVDESTWTDLEMDRLFSHLNRTITLPDPSSFTANSERTRAIVKSTITCSA